MITELIVDRKYTVNDLIEYILDDKSYYGYISVFTDDISYTAFGNEYVEYEHGCIKGTYNPILEAHHYLAIVEKATVVMYNGSYRKDYFIKIKDAKQEYITSTIAIKEEDEKIDLTTNIEIRDDGVYRSCPASDPRYRREELILDKNIFMQCVSEWILPNIEVVHCDDGGICLKLNIKEN